MDWKQLYSGYLSTPMLWEGTLLSMRQFRLDSIPTPSLQSSGKPNMRLGEVAEHFAFDYWEQHPELELVVRNLQINGALETLGEIDAIVRYKKVLYHLEMAYKIYLYDDRVGTTMLEHWIGPNRKDSLLEKLNRIQTHQLPLLHQDATKVALKDRLNSNEKIHSRVWLKAMLFLPYNTEVDIRSLNPDCIAGYYIQRERLSDFKDFKFYLPTKINWMIPPHANIPWGNHSEISDEIDPILEREFSPLIWAKSPKGKLSRLFVVWWE